MGRKQRTLVRQGLLSIGQQSRVSLQVRFSLALIVQRLLVLLSVGVRVRLGQWLRENLDDLCTPFPE